jgi:hypothetical protein
MSFEGVPTGELHAARVDLDHQIAALRERKLAIAREIESRFPEPEPQDQPAAQAVAPGFIESEAGVFNPNDPEPDVFEPRRRWWR